MEQYYVHSERTYSAIVTAAPVPKQRGAVLAMSSWSSDFLCSRRRCQVGSKRLGLADVMLLLRRRHQIGGQSIAKEGENADAG